MMFCYVHRGEYTNLSEQADDDESQAKAKQEEDDGNPDSASRGDKKALDGATQEGLDNQPSLAFFPANQTGYIAKVTYNHRLVEGWLRYLSVNLDYDSPQG